MTASARLVQAREAKGMSVSDVAKATRIPERHLRALEADDLAALPAKTYVVGFARSYARVVGLDEGEIVQAIGADYRRSAASNEVETAPIFTPGDPARVPSARFAWAAATVALLVAVGGFAWWHSRDDGVAGLPSLLPPDAPASAPARPHVPAPVAPAAQPSGPVVFTSQDDNVWVKFYDGAGKQLMQKLMAKGETYTVPADAANPMVWTGRPDALAITIGGKAVPALADGKQRIKDVPVSAAALLARGAPAPAAGAPAGATASPAPVASPSPAATPVAALAPRPHAAMRHVPRPAATASAAAAVAPAPVAGDGAVKRSTD
ncbi:MAG TPA: helix-turn-helix domain-containing protein [Novosphingobium sp.]|nr:helix-turn-helix domain-containing protein [Novosphingobium sp.]